MAPRTRSRLVAATLASATLLLVLANGACGLEQLSQGGGKADGGAATDAAAGDAAVTGAGCGVQGETGIGLCRATTRCPTVVVDSQTHPNCGFRINGAAVDLVCACGTALCPMGTFATCPQAAALLTSQTELAVCAQVSEGRCMETRGASSSSSGGSAKPGCDTQCVTQCGGGAGCAQVCGC